MSAKAGIPRRRHGYGHRHRLAKHGYFLTSDTRYFLARILAKKSRVSDIRMYKRVGRVRIGVRVGVSVGVVECQLNADGPRMQRCLTPNLSLHTDLDVERNH